MSSVSKLSIPLPEFPTHRDVRNPGKGPSQLLLLIDNAMDVRLGICQQCIDLLKTRRHADDETGRILKLLKKDGEEAQLSAPPTRREWGP
jgi:hypothetical protein